MNEWGDYAVLLGVIVALAGAWWRMDAFRDKLDELRKEITARIHKQDTDMTRYFLRFDEDAEKQNDKISALAERIKGLERNGY